MSKKILKTRTQFTSTLKKDMYEWIQGHSKETGVPISKLFDRAVIMLKNIEDIKKELTNYEGITGYQNRINGVEGVTAWNGELEHRNGTEDSK